MRVMMPQRMKCLQLIVLVAVALSSSCDSLIGTKTLPSTYSSLNKLRAGCMAKNRLDRNVRSSLLIMSAGDADKTPESLPLSSATKNVEVVVPTAATVEKEGDLKPAYLILGILLFTFMCNQWCRQSIYYLCDFSERANPYLHINAELNFDKEMYAALASFGFTAIFATFSTFVGGISDKNNRSVVVAVSCAVWSIATGMHSFARGFSDLIPLRAIVGASQAFFNPAAYTLISDVFPKSIAGRVNGILSSGVFLGGGLASLSIILDGAVGWRTTLQVVAAVGLFASLISFLFIKDPRATETLPPAAAVESSSSSSVAATGTTTTSTTTAVADDKSPIATATTTNSVISDTIAALREVTQSNEAKLLLAASTLRFCAGFSIAVWKAPFVFGKFPGAESAFAGSNAAVVAGGGLLSSLLGGYLSDALADPNRGNSKTESGVSATVGGLGPAAAATAVQAGTLKKPRARAWIPAVGSLLAAPFWASFILASDPTVAAVSLLGEYLVAECWFGPTLASLFNVVPKERRGTAQGLFSMLTAAGNIAPVLIGYLSGGTWGSFELSDVLLWTVCLSYVGSGILFGLAAVADDKEISKSWAEQN